MATYADLKAEIQAEIKVTQRQIDAVAGVNSNTFEVYDPSNPTDTILFTGTGGMAALYSDWRSNNPSVDSGWKFECWQAFQNDGHELDGGETEAEYCARLQLIIDGFQAKIDHYDAQIALGITNADADAPVGDPPPEV